MARERAREALAAPAAGRRHVSSPPLRPRQGTRAEESKDMYMSGTIRYPQKTKTPTRRLFLDESPGEGIGGLVGGGLGPRLRAMAAEGSGGLLGLGGYGSDLAESSPAEVHLWNALSGDLVRRVRLPKVPPPQPRGRRWGLVRRGRRRGRAGERRRGRPVVVECANVYRTAI